MSNLLYVRLVLIISKVFTILFLLCLCKNREYTSKFQDETGISKLFFQMSAQVKWERRPFWSDKKHRFILWTISYLHTGVMLTIIKVFIILFLLCLWEQGASWQFSNKISKLSFQLSFQIYSFLAWTEGERKAFFWKGAKRETTVQDYHLVDIRHEKVSLFMKFEIILPLLCFY